MAEPVVSARRPVRRYYLARTASRCEFFFVDPDHTSTRSSTPCPPDLRVGERIRIAGKTCMREGTEADAGPEADRVQPVVCPDPLTELEKRERGEPR
jgi:hypothetical protein